MASQVIAKVNGITGSVKVISAEGVIRELKVGDALLIGDRVQTGDLGAVELKFFNGDIYTLGPGAVTPNILANQDIDGGLGFDTIQVAEDDMSFSGADLDRVSNIESIDMSDHGDNALALNYQDVLGVTDSDSVLSISGDAGDSVTLQGSWTASDQVNIDGVTFSQYISESATVRIEENVQVIL